MSDPPDSASHLVLFRDEQRVPVDGRRLVALAARALEVLGVDAELSLTLVQPERMAELKERAFGVRERTDVLSFPIDDPADPGPGPVVLGDVVICPAVADRQARALGRRFDDELATLLVHGILHLLGRDHADAVSERAMAAEERDVLRQIGEVRAS